MAEIHRLRGAYLFSLMGGTIILVGSAVLAFMVLQNPQCAGTLDDPCYWIAGNLFTPLFLLSLLALAAVSGGVVIASSFMLVRDDTNERLWATFILMFSLVSMAGFGGFLVGSVLGMVGAFSVLAGIPEPSGEERAE